MIDTNQLKEVFDNSLVVKDYEKAAIVNSNLIYQDGSNNAYAVVVVEENGKYTLSDMGIVYDKLMAMDFDLNEDEDIQAYKTKTLSVFGVTFDDKNELVTYAETKEQIPFAIGRLHQCMTLLAYLPLQFEEESIEE